MNDAANIEEAKEEAKPSSLHTAHNVIVQEVFLENLRANLRNYFKGKWDVVRYHKEYNALLNKYGVLADTMKMRAEQEKEAIEKQDKQEQQEEKKSE